MEAEGLGHGHRSGLAERRATEHLNLVPVHVGIVLQVKVQDDPGKSVAIADVVDVWIAPKKRIDKRDEVEAEERATGEGRAEAWVSSLPSLEGQRGRDGIGTSLLTNLNRLLLTPTSSH